MTLVRYEAGAEVAREAFEEVRKRRGYSKARRAYDRRRRRERDPLAKAYGAIVRHDPCAFGRAGEVCHRQIAADHIVPLDGGGADEWGNLTAACRAHNAAKSNQDLLRWLLGR